MSTQTERLKELAQEFQELKWELFRETNFIVADDRDVKQKRYNQLLGFFQPQFRTQDWVSPMTVE